LQKKYKGIITSFSFRNKTFKNLGEWNSRNIKMVINGKTIILSFGQELYLQGSKEVYFLDLLVMNVSRPTHKIEGGRFV
jgi:hypothetical protein